MPDPSILVYTALVGGYDRLLEQPVEPGVDYLCLTDQPPPESRTWQFRPLVASGDPRRVARWCKTHPHHVTTEHDWTVWVDARVSIRQPTFVTDLVAMGQRAGIVVLDSRPRRCLYQEAEKVYAEGFDTSPALLRQIRRYRRSGLPPDWGLWSTMVVARDNRCEAIVDLDEAWYTELADGSVRDQVSLPYVAWRAGVTPTVLDVDPFRNDLFRMHHHLHRRRYPPRWQQRLNQTWFAVASRIGK